MDDLNNQVVHRLKIASGHLDKVIKMVETGEYCIDVLIQSKAVRNQLEKADEVLLQKHLSSCVVEHIKNGKTKQAVEEVMKVFANNN